MSVTQSTVKYRKIKGFPGYRVGDDGSVWSCRKQIGLGPGKGTRGIVGTVWRKLRPGIGTSGHRFVVLFPGKHMKLVHRLVLEAFVGPCPPGMQGRHFPKRNPGNNRLSNLRWGTPAQNSADRYVHGTIPLGVKHGNAKLTARRVRSIRRLWLQGHLTQEQIGARYGVTKGAVRLVVLGKLWKHVI